MPGITVAGVVAAIFWGAVTYAVSKLTQKKHIFSPKFEDNQDNVRSAVETRKVIYGEAMVGGPLVYAATSGTTNELLHIVVPVAGHEVSSIGDVYFDDANASNDFYTRTHIVDITAQAHMTICALAPYTVTLTLNGVDFPVSVNCIDGDAQPNATQITDTLYNNITGAAGYAAENYTVTRLSDVALRIESKTAGQEFTHSIATTDESDTVRLFASTQQRGSIWQVTKHLGAAAQAADADLVAAFPGAWTTDHKLSGVAYIYARLSYDADRWPTGIPVIKAVVKGKLVYDPRSTTTAWSDNPALCIRDYLLDTSLGLGADSTEIDDASFIAAANVCDELVYAKPTTAIDTSTAGNPAQIRSVAHGLRTGDSVVIAGHSQASANATWTVTRVDADNFTIPLNLATGGTGGTVQLQQKRYTCNGVVDTDKLPPDIIRDLLTSCDGSLVYSEGKYRLKAAAYSSPCSPHTRG